MTPQIVRETKRKLANKRKAAARATPRQASCQLVRYSANASL